MVALIFVSCKKQNNSAEIIDQSSAIGQVFSTKNYEAQKNMYKSLSADEKLQIWQLKYNQFLASETLTKEQRSLVVKLKGLLKKDVFSTESNEYKSNIQAKEGVIKNEAIKLFGISGAYNLMANLNNENLYPPGQGDCDCSRASDWCASGHSCVREGCRIIPDDCGWWWSYDCNGDCWMTGIGT